MSTDIKHPSKNQTYSPNRYRQAAIAEKFRLQLSQLPSAEGTQGSKQFGQATSSASSPVHGIDAQATQVGGTQAKHTRELVGELDAKAKRAILSYLLFTGHCRIGIPPLMSAVACQLSHFPIELTTSYYVKNGKSKKARLPSADRRHVEKEVRTVLAAVEARYRQANQDALQKDKESK